MNHYRGGTSSNPRYHPDSSSSWKGCVEQSNPQSSAVPNDVIALRHDVSIPCFDLHDTTQGLTIDN